MFIQKEFDENDARAKEKLVELMKESPLYARYSLQTPDDPFTIDFHVINPKGEHTANIEVEVKKTWHDFEFKYDDVQILPRKKKYWTDEGHHKNLPTMFVMFNADLSNHLVILSDDMEQIFENGRTRNYATEKTRNDNFYIAKKSVCKFGYFNKKVRKKPPIEEELL